MKKEFLILIIVVIFLVFGVKIYYDKKIINNI